ncbi:nitroreductase family protein [Lactococcus piscium]|uniref:nitroreductase family protein n=1 Tax=Pseudolactococcus carnosus TaxID=2749961 RepID=UPI00081255C1|nr:nitroreductase family protein [Lactococcus carnosus]SCA91043.1 probable NAD(P)H nitroreductase Spy0809 [Lactococcus piscium]MCJ1972736.1 nitroreductase family protein [Lactococcus carnosus]MCJ1975169.1 nitroreductase family protein [Lactococcus carnosus]MCJ1981503.1 nitroreductase family protein [Lactococcus carnosus]MCJ1985363.1 nitroreductase family protein [Lactococcus carnosus]
MEFSKVNHSRHKVTEFDGSRLPIAEVKAILAEAVLAPSAHNIQPWHFAIVASDEKRAALSTAMHGKNAAQHEAAGATLVVYSDTDLTERVHDLVEIGADFLPEASKEMLLTRLPGMFDKFSPEELSDYLALNIGLVAQNIVLVATDKGLKTNMILGFDKVKAKEVLAIEERFRPELIITMGYSDTEGTASYRLPVNDITDVI